MTKKNTDVFIAALLLLQGVIAGAAQPGAAAGGDWLYGISAVSLEAMPQTAPLPALAQGPGRGYGSYAGKLVVEPDDLRSPVLGIINNARRTIDVTIYTISDSQVVGALVAAQKRGVAVRVIYNYNSFAQRHIYPNDNAVQQIVAAGGQARKAGTAFAITHQKTITADGAASLIMTFNLSSTYFGGSRDFGYLTTDPAQVGEIERVFEADWNGTAITPSEETLVWSPVNSRSRILDIINGARKTLIVDNEETGDKQCMSALMDAAKRGVSVRFLTAVLSKSNADSTSDSGKDDANASERDILNAAGVQAKGASNHYMHAKMLLADYGSSTERGFIGSENFSSTSLNRNRELGVTLTDSTLLAQLDQVFETDWSANR